MNPIKKHKSVAVVGQIYKYLATGEYTGGAYALFETLVPPKDPGPPPHIHRNEDEAFYIISGGILVLSGRPGVRRKTGRLYIPTERNNAFLQK
jgi:uncharacterized cupin superfamily protein